MVTAFHVKQREEQNLIFHLKLQTMTNRMIKLMFGVLELLFMSLSAWTHLLEE